MEGGGGGSAAPDPAPPIHVALRAPDGLGDLATATPILEAAANDPRVGRLSILVPRTLAPLLAGAPYEPSVVPFDSDAEELALYRRLAPDAALLLTSSLASAWHAWRARVPIRAGAALSGRRWLLTHAVVPPTRRGRRLPIPTPHLNRDVAGLLGILVPSLRARLFVSDAVRTAARELLLGLGLGARESYVLCTPSAEFGAAKLWPPDRFAAVLDELHDRSGLRGVVSGGEDEAELIDAVARQTRTGAVSLASVARDLETLKALVRDAALLVTGDSGPRFVADALDVPCATVIGPTSLEPTASFLRNARALHVEGLECAPCFERRCPLGHHRCMQELRVDQVVDAALELLDAAGERPREE